LGVSALRCADTITFLRPLLVCSVEVSPLCSPFYNLPGPFFCARSRWVFSCPTPPPPPAQIFLLFCSLSSLFVVLDRTLVVPSLGCFPNLDLPFFSFAKSFFGAVLFSLIFGRVHPPNLPNLRFNLLDTSIQHPSGFFFAVLR